MASAAGMFLCPSPPSSAARVAAAAVMRRLRRRLRRPRRSISPATGCRSSSTNGGSACRPQKGDILYLPLNTEARQIANAWDPAKDEAEGKPCKAYGASA